MSIKISDEYKCIKNNIEGIKKYLLNNYEINRLDRLWPSYYRIFTTNPINIAFGACGVIEFLLDVNTKKYYLDTFYNWVLKHEINNENYPPGLYVGLSGIAWVLENGGLEDKAVKIMDMANQSKLIFDNPDVFYGASGVGMANLHFWYKLQEQKYLDMAYKLGDYLISSYEYINDKSFWNNKGGEIYIGYAHGASGVALFLLYLYQVEKRIEYLDFAIKYLMFDMSFADEGEDGVYRWFKNTRKKGGVFPYWEYGNAGINLVLVRFYKVLQDVKYLRWLKASKRYINIRFTATPGLFLGLSSIGESFLEIYQFLHDKEDLEIAKEIAENITMYSIKRDNGIVYPGQRNLRLSCDYATGSSGIGIFLNRLIKNKKRKFVNDYLLEK